MPPTQPQASTPNPTPAPQPQQAQPVSMQSKPKTNVLAIIGLILAFFVPVIAIILAIVGLSQMKKKGEGGKGLAIAAIIISVVVIVFQLLFVLLVIVGAQQAAKDKTLTTNNTQTTTTTTDTSTKKYNTATDGTNTLADSTLSNDIIKAIYVAESTTGKSGDVTITHVKLVSQTTAKVVEEWSVEVEGKKSVYTVTITPTAGGGSDYTVAKKS